MCLHSTVHAKHNYDTYFLTFILLLFSLQNTDVFTMIGISDTQTDENMVLLVIVLWSIVLLLSPQHTRKWDTTHKWTSFPLVLSPPPPFPSTPSTTIATLLAIPTAAKVFTALWCVCEMWASVGRQKGRQAGRQQDQPLHQQHPTSPYSSSFSSHPLLLPLPWWPHSCKSYHNRMSPGCVSCSELWLHIYIYIYCMVAPYTNVLTPSCLQYIIIIPNPFVPLSPRTTTTTTPTVPSEFFYVAVFEWEYIYRKHAWFCMVAWQVHLGDTTVSVDRPFWCSIRKHDAWWNCAWLSSWCTGDAIIVTGACVCMCMSMQWENVSCACW